MTKISTKESAVLAVALFLLVMVIYSPSVKIDVFGQSSCVWSNNHTHVKCCQYYGYSYRTPTPKRICYECDFNLEAHTQKCTGWYGEELVAPPPPPPPPPASTLGPPPSTTAEQPPSTTCPDGSAPDAKGNCPSSSNTLQQISPDQGLASKNDNNNNPQGDHHHKSKDTNHLGQESTSKKGDNGGSSDQGSTTQSPP
jgi:hypothetical protein